MWRFWFVLSWKQAACVARRGAAWRGTARRKRSLKSGEKGTAVSARGKHPNPRDGRSALWSRIIPITPVTQTPRNKGQKPPPPPPLPSGDSFITQAKANFDKQLGTISPNLGMIGRGEGGLEVMKKCASTAPMEKRKKTCWKKMFQL